MPNRAHVARAVQSTTGRWHKLNRLLFGRVQGAVAVVVWIVSVLGCMSINVGGGDSKTSDASGVLVQEGKIAARPGSEQIIHYPKTYSAPPNLELTEGVELCDIVEQKESYFRVRVRP